MKDVLQKINEAPVEGQNLILRGPTGTGKTIGLQERYRHMAEDLRIPGDKILILLQNTPSLDDWKEKISAYGPMEPKCNTFKGFIQEELKIYYSLAVKSCADILNKDIKPTFLNFETSCFLLSRVIKFQRENSGAFAGISAKTQNIAYELYTNLLRAAASEIPHQEIGERLYQSLELKDEIKKQTFMEADGILKAYREKCLKLGVLDYAVSIELYNNFLLKDTVYISQLTDRVKYLIVDNLEAAEPVQISFIELLLPHLKHCSIAYNSQGGYGELDVKGGIHAADRLLEHHAFSKADIIEFTEPYTCSKFMNEFSEKLFENIENTKGYRMLPDLQFERTPASELRSEMLENIGQRICRLVLTEGYKPSEIAVISTYADPVTQYSIERILKNHNITLKNLDSLGRFTDNALSLSLITLAQVCFPSCNIYPVRDQIKVMLQTLTGMDAVRSSKLAGEACRSKPWVALPEVSDAGREDFDSVHIAKYKELKNWVNEFSSKAGPKPLHEFFQYAFLDLLLCDETSTSDISIVRQLVESSRSFNEVVPKFNNINPIRGFIEIALGGTAVYSTHRNKINDEEDSVLLGTPKSFLTIHSNTRVMILSSISSKNWMPRNVRELSNAYVMGKSWETGSVYSEKMEEQNQKHILAMLMRNLLKRCGERVITFESDLSSGGFENEGELSIYLDEIFSEQRSNVKDGGQHGT